MHITLEDYIQAKTTSVEAEGPLHLENPYGICLIDESGDVSTAAQNSSSASAQRSSASDKSSASNLRVSELAAQLKALQS